MDSGSKLLNIDMQRSYIDSFLNWCSKFFSQNPRDNNILKFVDFRTKWIVLPYSGSFSVETKYIEAKLHPFSGEQEYNITNSIQKGYHLYFFSLFVCQHSCRISVLCAHFFVTKDEIPSFSSSIYFPYTHTKLTILTLNVHMHGVSQHFL